MSRLDAALIIEQDMRRALDARIAELDDLVHDCQHAVLMGLPCPTNRIRAKATAVEDASLLWDAARGGVANIRANRRAA